jgi:hypothetical protein
MPERILILIALVIFAALLSAMIKAFVRRRHHIEQIDPGELGPDGGTGVVVFTSPYCHGCREWIAALEQDSIATTRIDVAERPDAAARYRITTTPRVVVVEPSGAVLREFHHHEPRRSDLDQIVRLTRSR